MGGRCHTIKCIMSRERASSRGRETREQIGLGVMIGSVYFLPLVGRVCREWLSALRWVGEAVVRVGSLFRRKAWGRMEFVFACVCVWGGAM